MPSVSAPNLVLLRTTQHKTRLNLAVYQPAELWHAQVDGSPAYGETAFTVKNASPLGAMPATVGANFQVMFSAVGYGLNDLGEARYKSYADTGGGTGALTVGAHNTPLADNTYITILNEIKPVAIHATLNATDVVSEDGTTGYGGGATGQNLQYHPLARFGPPACAFIDSGTGLATVSFASASTAIATGAALASYAWVFPSGTPATSAVAAPGNVTWNTAGQYYVSLTVTDSNGKTHKTYRPVFIYDALGGATRPYSQVEIESLEGDVASGIWRASLKVWGAATEAEFPDNAMVVLFAEDWYGDTQVSIGGQYTGRENIVWVGYVRGGSVKKNAEYGYIEFDAESISGVMANLEGLAATLVTNAGTPSDWHQLSNMTYNRAAFHLLTEHSTIAQIADCYLSLLSFTRDTLDLPESSLFDQLQFNIAMPTRGQCGCSAQGMFYLEENPQLIPLADRTHPNVFANSPAPNLASMSLADFRGELDFGRDVHDKIVGQIDFSAESTAAAAIYSLAPPTPWASGRGERISGIRADSQADSNIFAGLFEGYRNNPYADVVLPLRGNYRVCDTFPPEQVQITLTAAQNKRGFAWSNQRCWIKSINYEYRTGGILLPTVVVEKDAYGYPGITGNYPPDPPVWPPPEPPPVEPPLEPPDNPPVVGEGKGNLLYVSTHKGLAKCVGAYGTNGTDGTPVWTKMNGSGGGALGDVVIRWFNLDPFSVSGDHFTAGWAMTDTGLYRVTGLPDAPVWALQLSLADMAGKLGIALGNLKYSNFFTPSVRKAGFICVAAGFNSSYAAIPYMQVSLIVSYDYGATWSCDASKYLNIRGTVWNNIKLQASYHLDDTYYLSYISNGQWIFGNQTTPNLSTFLDGNNAQQIAKSTALPLFVLNDGANIATAASGSGTLHSPYCDATGNIYADDARGYITNPTTAIRLGRSSNLFTVVPPATVSYTNIGDAAMPALTWFFTNIFDENHGVAIDPANIWLSSNLSQISPTWTQKNNPTIGGRTLTPRYLFCIPIDSNIVFFTGSVSGAGFGMPCFTYDYNTLVDISLFGTGGAFDTVMGLGSDADMDDSTIIVDYYKP